MNPQDVKPVEICWGAPNSPTNLSRYWAKFTKYSELGAVMAEIGWREHVEEILLFNKFFFRLSTHALVTKIQPDKVVRWCTDGDCLHPVFSASRTQHISDLHSKFALER